MPKKRQIRLAVAKPQEEAVSDKLLLTPALRVEEPAAKTAKTKAAKPRTAKPKQAKPEPVVTLVSVSPPPERVPTVELVVTAAAEAPQPKGPVDTMEAVIAALSQATAVEETVAAVTQGVVVELNERRAEREEPKGEVSATHPDLTAEDDAPVLGMPVDELRDLVRDVLRAELQGEFGERITRNVRKLVRAEIARALMSRGIE